MRSIGEGDDIGVEEGEHDALKLFLSDRLKQQHVLKRDLLKTERHVLLAVLSEGHAVPHALDYP